MFSTATLIAFIITINKLYYKYILLYFIIYIQLTLREENVLNRNEKVEFTMEGYRRVLEALNIEGEMSDRIANGNSSATVTSLPTELKEALLAEVVANFVL